MNDRMISGIMNDRKVENSEVKVASRRMMVTKNAVSAMPNHCPHIPMRIPAMMPIISRINSPNCFTYIYSSFSQNMKLLLQPECAGWTRIFLQTRRFSAVIRGITKGNNAVCGKNTVQAVCSGCENNFYTY